MRAIVLLITCAFYILPAWTADKSESFVGYLVDQNSIRKTDGRVDEQRSRAAYHRQNALSSSRVQD